MGSGLIYGAASNYAKHRRRTQNGDPRHPHDNAGDGRADCIGQVFGVLFLLHPSLDYDFILSPYNGTVYSEFYSSRRIDADVATVDRLRVYFYKRGYVYCHRDFCQFTYKDDPRGGDAFVWNALFAIVGAGLVSKFALPDSGFMAWLSQPVDYLQTFRHLEDFSNSLLDTRPFFLYISTACMLLAVTSLITEAKNA